MRKKVPHHTPLSYASKLLAQVASTFFSGVRLHQVIILYWSVTVHFLADLAVLYKWLTGNGLN